MLKKKLLPFFFFFCISIPAQASYEFILDELQKDSNCFNECKCIPGMDRKVDQMDSSLRGELDRKAAELVSEYHSGSEDFLSLFFIGSGCLLNEMTVTASIMSKGVPLRIFLIDRFYGMNTIGSYAKYIRNFRELTAKIAIKYGVKYEVYVFTDFSDSLKEYAKHSSSKAAFFLTDVIFPTSEAMMFFKERVEAMRDLSLDSLYFILSKENETDYTPDPNNVYRGMDPAVLEVYKVHLQRGILSQDLIYRKSQQV